MQIVVQKGFDQGLVDAGAVIVAGKGPQLPDQTAIGSPFGLEQDDPGGSGAPLVRSQLIVGAVGKMMDGPRPQMTISVLPVKKTGNN